MPSFSKPLEEAIHQALALANDRKHELATLEHLLLALLDEPDATRVMQACSVDLDVLRKVLVEFIDEELTTLITDIEGNEAVPDRSVPARDPTRRDPCPKLGPDRSDRRQCAGRHLRRTRIERGLLPARAGHDPL